MAAGEDLDSGMDSPSTDENTVKKRCIEDDDEDIEDETLSERLWGLTEMFPNEVRRITWTVVTKTCNSIKCIYSFSRTATWIFFSSSLILFAPVIFEIERANMEEAQRREQKQLQRMKISASVLLTAFIPFPFFGLGWLRSINWVNIYEIGKWTLEAVPAVRKTISDCLLNHFWVLLGPNAALSGGPGPGLISSR